MKKLYILALCALWSFTPKSALTQENIEWLTEFTKDMTVGSNTLNYSFKTINNSACKIGVDEKKTDKKGESSLKTFQFYLSDLNVQEIAFKASGSIILVTLPIKQSQKFISIFNNNELAGYTESMEITFTEVDAARNFINVLKQHCTDCKVSERKWSSPKEAADWLATNITNSETSGINYKQSFKAGEKPYLGVFRTESTDSKGIQQNIDVDFNFSDINSSKINLIVSGKTFKINFPVRDNKYFIRLKKENEDISFSRDFDIYADDLELARNIYNAMEFLTSETKVPVRKEWTSYSAALEYVKENLVEVKTNNAKVVQSLVFPSSLSGRLSFNFGKTDAKGIAEETVNSLYLSDLQKVVEMEATAKVATLTLSAKDKNKYVQVTTAGIPQSYGNSFEIFASDIEKARELVNALEYAIEKSESGIIEFNSAETAIAWLTSNVSDIQNQGPQIKQVLKINTAADNKMEMQVISTNESGGAISGFYSWYPEDLLPQEITIKVSGKKLSVIVSTGKLKYIKAYKDDIQQAYSTDAEILFEDVQKAKICLSALKTLQEKSVGKNRSVSSNSAASAYLVSNITKIEGGGVKLDQKYETRDNEVCKAKLTITETNSKGESVENAFEFSLSDIDQATSSITVSGKSLQVSLNTKNKEKLIKPYKNGVAGSFTASCDILVDDVVMAKKILVAFVGLASGCK